MEGLTARMVGFPMDSGVLAGSRSGIDAIVFDFDLTLADSTAAVVDCANYALAALGEPPAAPSLIRRTIGLTLPHTFRMLTGRGDPEREAEFARRFVERADEVMVSSTRIYERVPPALEELRHRAVRIAIVSTKFRYRIEAILAKGGLVGAIDVIVGGEDVAHHKPHPEGLLKALTRLGVAPSRAVYVGDHVLDAEAARAAGVSFIAVQTGAQPGSWSAFRPLAVIPDAGAIASALDSAAPSGKAHRAAL